MEQSAAGKLHVAIIGGGLCGVSLAAALSKRSVSYTIYEARASFSEIGAGISLSPNAFSAFDFIDPALCESISKLVTRNQPGKEDVFMTVRLGSPTKTFGEGEFILDLKAPPTGSTSVGRNELLQAMASWIPPQNAKFNRRLVDFKQSGTGVTLFFENGTQESCSLAIGCDGAHSMVRKLMLGSQHPGAAAQFTGKGVYRAVLPMEEIEPIVGSDKANSSHIWTGPDKYMIMYPIDGGKKVNLGFWSRKTAAWDHSKWVIDNQKDEMRKDFEQWGNVIHRIIDKMDDEIKFWATFHHSIRPDSYHRNRVLLIGDAAHAMSPHHGQGASQSIEDACVIAALLQQIDPSAPSASTSRQIAIALSAYEQVRKPRFESIIDSSDENYFWWTGLWDWELTHENIHRSRREAYRRWDWIWNTSITDQAERAKLFTRPT